MLELIQKLMSCKPVTADKEAVNKAMAVMKEYLEAHGVACVMEKGHKDGRDILFASTRPGKAHQVLLNAHLDVVPPLNEEQWTLRAEGDKMYGRGCEDCLANAVAMARVLIEAGPAADVGAIFTADEETGGSTTGDMVKYGYVPTKLGIVLDGSMIPSIAVAQKGIKVMTLVAHGKGGHSSAPWALDNPIDRLIEGYSKLKAVWKNPTKDDMWHDSMAAVMIKAGFASNQIPDEAEMTLNFRYIEQGGEEKLEAMVREITGLEVRSGRGCAPLVSDPEAPAIKALRAAWQAAFPEKEGKCDYMNGATDARHMAHLGVPIAISGLCGGGGAHSATEHIQPAYLEKGTRCLIDFVKDFAK